MPTLPFTAADGSLTGLVDCDSFFVSCERVARPDLAGKPVVVLSNNDGCVVARSKEAKKLGIRMGVPAFQIQQFLKANNVAVFSSNYTLYGDLSHRVMETVRSVVPDIEVYSIDEAFVHFSGALSRQPVDAAKEIRSRVAKWVGVPVSIGIAPTKVLAKIATKVAKKYPAYGGVFNLSACTKLEKLLASVPVRDLWGIGRKGALKLRSNGITTALQLREADTDFIRSLLTVNGLNLLMELRGTPAIKEDIPATHTTIISSRSLGYKVMDLAPMEEAVAYHAARAAEKLRQRNLITQMVSVSIQTAYYAEDQPQHHEMASIRLESPTFDTAVIIQAAHRVLKRIFRYGYGYAKAMVMLTDLSDPDKEQPDMLGLIDNRVENDARRRKLLELVDKINRLEGRGTLRFASTGALNAKWHMNRKLLSPAWTTDIHNLLKVSAVPGEYAVK